MDNQFYTKPQHPDANSAKIMGIISLACILLVFACGCVSIIGMVLGIIAVVKAKRVKKDFYANIGAYHINSLQDADLGYSLGIAGTVISAIINFFWIIFVGLMTIQSMVQNGVL